MVICQRVHEKFYDWAFVDSYNDTFTVKCLHSLDLQVYTRLFLKGYQMPQVSGIGIDINDSGIILYLKNQGAVW